MALVDEYLPEQSGYGVFRMDSILCIGLLWCAGIDLLAIPSAKVNQSLVDEVIYENEEASMYAEE